MEDKQFNELKHELTVITKLLAMNLLQDKNLTEQVLLLSSAGIGTGDIAKLLQKDSSLISQTLYQAKKARGSDKRHEKADG